MRSPRIDSSQFSLLDSDDDRAGSKGTSNGNFQRPSRPPPDTQAESVLGPAGLSTENVWGQRPPRPRIKQGSGPYLLGQIRHNVKNRRKTMRTKT